MIAAYGRFVHPHSLKGLLWTEATLQGSTLRGTGVRGHPGSAHCPPPSSGHQRLLSGRGSLPGLHLLQNVPSWPNVRQRRGGGHTGTPRTLVLCSHATKNLTDNFQGPKPGPFTLLVKPRLSSMTDTHKVHPRRLPALQPQNPHAAPTARGRSHRTRVNDAHAVLPSAFVRVHASLPGNLNTAFKIQLKCTMFQKPSQTAPHPNHRDTPHLSIHPFGSEY